MFFKHHSAKAHCGYWVIAPPNVKSDSVGVCTHSQGIIRCCIQVHLVVTVRSLERGRWFGYCHDNTVKNTRPASDWNMTVPIPVV